MAEYSLSQLTEDLTAADSDLLEVSKSNGDGTYTSKKQTRSTLLTGTASQSDLDAHEADTANPHGVTKAQVGLSNVDNTADLAKPVSTATQAALDTKASTVHTHDDRYYTETETNTLLNTKADTTALHSHANKTVLDATTASFTSADETKLDGITAGATANSTDATLLNRTNHTGTQAIATVSGLQIALDAKSDDGHAHVVSDVTGLQTALDAKAATADIPATIVQSVVAGNNVTIDNTDPANPVISSTGGGGGGGAVDSVNGETGVVVLDADDIDDTATEHKFTTSSEKDKLSGVEFGATADMTGAEIKTAYEAEADTNAYTDSEKAKLAGIASGAEVNEIGAADIADFETTTELNARDTANRDRANHTGSQAISTVTGLQTALDGKASTTHTHPQSDITNLTTDMAGKQATLVSGTNIKTINGSSILGAGDLAVSGGGGGSSVAFQDEQRFYLMPQSIDKYLMTLSGSTVGDSEGLHIQHSSTALSQAYIRTGPNIIMTGFWDKTVSGRMQTRLLPPASARFWCRFASDSGNANYSTTKTVGWRMDESTQFLAANCSGTAETSTNISASAPPGSYSNTDLSFVHTAATNIKFYNKGTLLATHTTNLPSGNSVARSWLDFMCMSVSGGNKETKVGLFELKVTP